MIFFQMHYKLSPFYFSVVSFYGFPKDEQRHMEEVTVANGEELFFLNLIFKCFNLFCALGLTRVSLGQCIF